MNPPPGTPSVLRLGTRGSLLARTQSQSTADAIMRLNPGVKVELKIIQTSGDRFTGSLADAGGKGLFTKELELALLANEIDFAVHSLKDVPVTMPLVDQSDLIIAAIPAREDARDCFVSRIAKSPADLPRGAVIGTCSLRRQCQVLSVRPDCVVQPLRGNVDTRLRKLNEGQYAAIVLAMAGIKRLGLFNPEYMTPIDMKTMLPAAGQGALAIQCRRADHHTASILASMDDPSTHQAVVAERAVVQGLGGDCHSPIAAWSIIDGGQLALSAAVGQRDGKPPVKRVNCAGSVENWRKVVDWACSRLLDVNFLG